LQKRRRLPFGRELMAEGRLSAPAFLRDNRDAIASIFAAHLPKIKQRLADCC
jgi:hypothetical protein